MLTDAVIEETMRYISLLFMLKRNLKNVKTQIIILIL